jgi:hypothetical protein
MNGDQPSFAEFCVADRQDAALQIHIVSLKVERFADPQAGGGQESKKAMIGPPTQRVRRG